MVNKKHSDSWLGCLLGMAVGDAVGLPLEGLSPHRIQKLFGKIEDDFEMCLIFRRGFVSDDTEHAVITFRSYVASNGNDLIFQKCLARELKYWILTLHPGTGLATAKACLKLLCGVNPSRSGVLSAGNGPAMRAPILGVLCDDEDHLRRMIAISSRLTHSDARAELGSFIIALATRFSKLSGSIDSVAFLHSLSASLEVVENSKYKAELYASVQLAAKSASSGQSTPEFANSMQLSGGVSGYILHTVPIVIHSWLRYPENLRLAVLECLRCGGDTDSNAAIVAGIVGARIGEKGIPSDWLKNLAEWPHGADWIRDNVNYALYGSTPPFSVRDIFVLPRNLFLLSVVLFHGFRRILPPY